MTGLRLQIASFNANLQGSQATRPDLTPWLIPTVRPSSSSSSSSSSAAHPSDSVPSGSSASAKAAPLLPADHFRSTNPNTPSTHPSLPREAPDFYAVGFQELVPLHEGLAATSGLALYNTDLDVRRTIRPHQARVSGNGLYAPPEQGGGPESYALLCKVDLVGIALFVYARERAPHASKGARSAATRVKEIRKATVGTGLAGVMGNKGAVGVRLVVASADGKGPDEAITFVCAHLAAHDHNVERRNRDWKNVVQRLVFEPSSVVRLPIVQDTASTARPTPTDLGALKQQYEASQPTRVQKSLDRTPKPLDGRSYTLYDTSHLVVFGDLNHRIALGPSQVELPLSPRCEKASTPSHLTKDGLGAVLESGQWASLQAHDQLTMQRLATPVRAFHGLTELSFQEMDVPPTYKYKVVREGQGQSKREKQKAAGGEKANADKAAAAGQELSPKRIPGWTDRILWASAAGGAGEVKGAFDKQGVEVEFFRSIMEMVHSDHKPITTLLHLGTVGGSDSGSGNGAVRLLSDHNPYPPLPALQRRALSTAGWLLDRLVGYLWSLAILAGGGSVVAGLVEVAVLTAIAAWWLRANLEGGGGGGDLAWWLYRSVLRR
ncbi:hypothetical protein ACQY0O_000386 [Thecaphora frezii]